MSQHLSREQMDGWLIGERPAEVASHLGECGACAGKLAGIGGTLTLFGSAVRSWSEEQMGPVRTVRRVSHTSVRWWQMALVFATLLVLIAVPVTRHRQARLAAAAQDEALLKKVQQEISLSVPAPMEPLAKLMPNDLSR